MFNSNLRAAHIQVLASMSDVLPPFRPTDELFDINFEKDRMCMTNYYHVMDGPSLTDTIQLSPITEAKQLN